jgi:hypothetical protein
MKLKVYRNDELVNEFGNGHATRSFLQALANKAIHAMDVRFKYRNNYTEFQTITEIIKQNTLNGVDIYKYEYIDVPVHCGQVDVNQILTEYMEYMASVNI